MVPEPVAPVPVSTDVGVVEVAGTPGDILEAVELVGGYGTDEIIVLLAGLLLPTPVREEGGILNGAGDPGNVAEAVPFVAGYETELAVDGD